jgi:LPXTG-motif cell wall-anchored protein
VLESGEVDARRALCVEGADLTVKDSGGCSVTKGAGAKSSNGFLAIVALFFGLATVVVRRRRKRS